METFDAVFKILRILFVDVVSVALTWPVFATVLVLIFRCQLRHLLTTVADKICNLTKGPNGIEFRQNNRGNLDSKPPYADTDHVEPDDEVLDNIEKNIQKEHEGNIKALSADKQREFYIRKYAIALRSEQFLIIGMQIYGTQVAALRQLDVGTPQTKDALMSIFAEHKRRVGNTGASVDFYSWISFLLIKALISTDAQGYYNITAA